MNIHLHLLILGIAVVTGTVRAAETAAGPGRALAIGSVELRGRVVCLPEEMHRLYRTDLATTHTHIYGFRQEDGSYYTLLRGKMSEALFVDEKMSGKELIITGRVLPRSQVLEVTGNLKSIRAGKVYELYYYCAICAIESVSPAPCMCCQEPVELLERPVADKN